MSYISEITIDNQSYPIKDQFLRDNYDDIVIETNHILNNDYIVGLQVDYENKTFTRLATAEELNAGSDFDQFNMYGGRRVCNVANDGTILAWYGDSNFKEDGSNGQVMVYQPKFYYKVEPLKLDKYINGCYHLRKANYYISDYAFEGFRLHPAFYDKNGNEIDYILDSTYEGSLYDTSENNYILNDAQVADFNNDLLCSISDAKPISGKTQNLTRANAEKLAINRGDGWHITNIQVASMEQLLIMIEYGSCNLQNSLGSGVSAITDDNSSNLSVINGKTKNLGNGSGIDNSGSIRYRGKENPYGNIWKFVEGMLVSGDGTQQGGIVYINLGFNYLELLNKYYINTGFMLPNSNGYINSFAYKDKNFDWLFVPSEVGGNSSLPVGDYLYVTSNLSGLRLSLLGGRWTDGPDCGPFYWYLNISVGNRYRRIGGRPIYIPTASTN